MSRKTILFALALVSAAPAFAAQADYNCKPVSAVATTAQSHTSSVSASSAPAKPAYTQLRDAQPERRTADEYAPSMRAVYFGH
jgi:hypothetical protein